VREAHFGSRSSGRENVPAACRFGRGRATGLRRVKRSINHDAFLGRPSHDPIYESCGRMVLGKGAAYCFAKAAIKYTKMRIKRGLTTPNISRPLPPLLARLVRNAADISTSVFRHRWPLMEAAKKRPDHLDRGDCGPCLKRAARRSRNGRGGRPR
jgi:hypothetical protein